MWKNQGRTRPQTATIWGCTYPACSNGVQTGNRPQKMYDFACRVFRRVMVIYRDKLALRPYLDRIKLWDIVLSDARKHKLVEVFKINHAAPCKQKCRKIQNCILRHSKRPESHRDFTFSSASSFMDHYLLCRLYHIFLTRSTIFFSLVVRFAYPEPGGDYEEYLMKKGVR